MDALKKEERAHAKRARFEIEAGVDSAVRLDELIASASMFSEGSFFILCRGVLRHSVCRDAILSRLHDLEASPHITVFLEDKLEAALKKKLALATKRVFVFDIPERGPREVFALSDMVVRGERARAWAAYMAMLETGVSGDDIAPIIAWKLRTTLSRMSGETAERTRISRLSGDLLRLIAGVRTEADIDIDRALERYILSM